MFSIARKAASRLRFANIFNRAIGLTTNATTESNNVAEHRFPLSECNPTTRHPSRGVRSRKRRVPFMHNATTPSDVELVPNSRLLTNLRDQYRGATAVRTRVRRHNELRKERSLQRVLRSEGSAASSSREFHVLAENVQQALVTSEVPKTREDVIFERGFAELVGDFVAARKVVDAEFAKEVASTFDQIDEQDFMVQLDEERARVESAMAVKEAEEQTEREERERERKEKAAAEERQRERELEKIRRVNEARIREAEERRREDRVRRMQEEHEDRLREERRLRDQERRARVDAERIARLERERVSRLEEDARLAREREAQRLRDEEQARAWIDAEAAKLEAEMRAAAEEKARREADEWQQQASRRLNEYVQSLLDPEILEGASQRFQAQENRLRAQLEEAARAQAQEHWFYVQPEHHWQQPAQDFWSDFIQDTPMRDSPNVDIDISMASIDDPFAPLPKSESEWFKSYETRWQDLRGPNTSELAFPSFPWPVFQLIRSLDQLADEDIKRFFASKYPGKLDKNWKVELTRWHPDKVERLRNRIPQDCVELVRMGFLRCTTVMNAFQEEREAERT